MRVLAICLFAALVGCTTTKTITIDSRPPGAMITFDDGSGRAKAPVPHQFTWDSETKFRHVTASLSGYLDGTAQIAPDYGRNEITIDLKPQTKKLNIAVNVPAYISVDGTRVSPEYQIAWTTPDLPVERDVRTNKWREHTITAERTGFKCDPVTANYPDGINTYTLVMKPLEKELNVTTLPPGGSVFFDKETDPLGDKATREFPYDLNSNDYVKHTLRGSLRGYPDAVLQIGWDNGQENYTIPLVASKKTVKIHTEPPGGVVTMDGKELKRDAAGDSIATNLSYPPSPDGKLPSYAAHITREAGDHSWYPQDVQIPWDNGQKDYTFTLKEIRSVKLPLLTMVIDRPDSAWKIGPRWEDTTAGKFTNEAANVQLQQLTPADVKGQSIDSLAISPDGKRLLFTVLLDKPSFRSRMYALHLDDTKAVDQLGDGQSLDVTPSFSPDGQQVLFSSDRFGNHLNIWSVAANGAPGAEQYTSGDTTDLWPCMDSAPKPRIFCQNYSDRRNRPQLFSIPRGSNSRRDLGIDGGLQPRINPKNDTVVYSIYNEKTRNRDIYKVSDQGGLPTNITNTADIDEFDATWDRDGAQIAFVSNAGKDPDEQLPNANIWILDTANPTASRKQITTNVSQDDHPVWDPSGRAIYFRSNRGGEWGIWKISLK